MNEKFIPLNEVFSYGIKGDTAHIHIPERVNKLLKEKGPHYVIEYVSENLYDALTSLCEVAEVNPKIKKVFAVSPLLSIDEIRERIEVLGFRTEPASAMFLRMFPNQKNLCQGSIPIERLKQVLKIEKEARENLDSQGEIWHNRILYYKYNQLKDIGIIDYYRIPLNKIIKMGKMNYNYRHGLPLEESKKQLEEVDFESPSQQGEEKNNISDDLTR